MKLNSTIGLTLILLTSMLIAGMLSAVAGMSVGREALKGITQPDTRPTNNLANRKGGTPRKDELLILPEDKIITTVKARIQGGKAASAAAKVTPTAVKSDTAAQAKFPIVGENGGVSLEIKSAQQQGDSLVLSVSLRNTTDDPVKFLYSFLEIKDEQGQAVSASAEGLPSDLPSDGEAYTGTIRIPSTSVDKSQKLSLLLTDYPDQQIKLRVSNIPIVR